MRADYHFHPNLYGKNPARRLRALWKAVARNKLDAIICAEHVFKNAPKAYRAFISSRPKGMRTHVFPGAELVSSDGIDVIAFAKDDWYDAHPRLLRPYAMSLEEMIAYLKSSDLRYFIPHPTLMGTPLTNFYPEGEKMQTFLASVQAFEVFNGCHLLLEHLCAHPLLKPFFGEWHKTLRRRAQLDINTYLQDSHAFIAIGSDAHHPQEVGFSVEIRGHASSRQDAFHRLTTNRDATTLNFPAFRYVLPRLIAMGWTTLTEGAMRRAIIHGFPSTSGSESEPIPALEIPRF